MSKTIGVVVGSLRKESFSKQIAEELKKLAPSSLLLESVEIENLEMFNQDFDDYGNTPESWQAFREDLKRFDGFLFVTPEYNRSYPAVIKNALDVGSRPYGQNVWSGKPAAIVSVSPGALAAFGANHHLRQVLVFLNVPVMPTPEAYVGNVMDLFDDNGQLVEDTKEFLESFMKSYEEWVDKF